LEELAHHPGVRQDAVDPFHRGGGGHGRASATAGRAGAAAACRHSPYSFENRTSPAPNPAATMPTKNVHGGVACAGPKNSAVSGCQYRLKTVLMTGANAKISGATKMRGPRNSKVAKMTHSAPRAPAVPESVAKMAPRLRPSAVVQAGQLSRAFMM